MSQGFCQALCDALGPSPCIAYVYDTTYLTCYTIDASTVLTLQYNTFSNFNLYVQANPGQSASRGTIHTVGRLDPGVSLGGGPRGRSPRGMRHVCEVRWPVHACGTHINTCFRESDCVTLCLLPADTLHSCTTHLLAAWATAGRSTRGCSGGPMKVRCRPLGRTVPWQDVDCDYPGRLSSWP